MKTLMNALTGLSFMLIILTGCQKEQEPAITKEKISGDYQLTAQVYQMPDGKVTDLYAGYESCKRGERHSINANQTYQVTDACSGRNAVAGPWCLVSTQILLLNRVTFEVISFDGTHLVISRDDEEKNGREISTFTRL
jgi:hypothetical protein